MLSDLLPAHVRKRVYLVYGSLGVVLTAAQAGFASVGGAVTPDWLAVSQAIYASLGAGFGLLAAGNTFATPPSEPPTHPPTDLE